MPKTAIPGTPEDPLADPFDFWNGKAPGQQSGAAGFEGDPGTPQVGAPAPTPPPPPPPAPRPPEDPYMAAPPATPPQATSVDTHHGVISGSPVTTYHAGPGPSTPQPSGITGPFDTPVDAPPPNPQIGYPDPIPIDEPPPPPSVSGPPPAPLGDPNQPPPLPGPGGIVTSSPDEGIPPEYALSHGGDPNPAPMDLDRVLMTYLLSHRGM